MEDLLKAASAEDGSDVASSKASSASEAESAADTEPEEGQETASDAETASEASDNEVASENNIKSFGEMLGVQDEAEKPGQPIREPSETSKRSRSPDRAQQSSSRRKRNANNDFVAEFRNGEDEPVREPYADSYRYAELSHEEINVMKLDLLYKINILNDAGFDSPKTFTVEDSLVALEAEQSRLNNLEDLQYGMQMMRYVLTNGVSLFESINENFGLSPLKLKGWSVTVHRDVNKYNPILMELYQQHAYAVQLSPLTKLCFALAFSAASTHLANSMRVSDSGSDAGSNIFSSVMSMFGGRKAAAPKKPSVDSEQPKMQAPPKL